MGDGGEENHGEAGKGNHGEGEEKNWSDENEFLGREEKVSWGGSRGKS